MTKLLWTLWTFRIGARGPQNEEVLASPAAKLKLDGFPLGNKLVAVRAPDFRQISLVHSVKSVAPRE
jgi:hypothetical protein